MICRQKTCKNETRPGLATCDRCIKSCNDARKRRRAKHPRCQRCQFKFVVSDGLCTPCARILARVDEREKAREERELRAAIKRDSEDNQTIRGPRCKCGSIFKCAPGLCVPTILELATSRRGESSGIGPAHASHSGNAKGGSRMP